MRVEGKGVVDRSRSVAFGFNGRSYKGHPGDTMASALLANGVRLVGRSFKYHRPRGLLSDGSQEPNGLVELHRSGEITPNVRLTMQEVHAGIEAVSQNHLGSLEWDFLEVNDLIAPVLTAGFYYKTFMWPRSMWTRFYEPLIRRAAGLGRLSMRANSDVYEKAFAQCDLLVIGAGPAGIMAALTAAQAGADVILAEEDFRFGGRLNAEVETLDDASALDWVAAKIAQLSAMDNVRLMARTCVTGAYDGGTYGALERVALHVADPGDAPLECFWRISAKVCVNASGATERPIAFANNDRPGVMLASSVRGYLNRFGVAAGTRVAVFGNNDDAQRTARDLQASGIEIAAYIDSRPDAVVDGDFEVLRGAQVSDVIGRKQMRAIKVGGRRIEADCLAVSGGWNPVLHLASHMNKRPQWNENIAAFVPTSNMVPGMHVAGSAGGTFTTKGCLKSGIFRAKEALRTLGIEARAPEMPRAADETPYAISPLWQVPGRKRAWLDYQNDVTVKDVAQSAAEGFGSVEHMKRYTTQGMAPDQGKSSNVNALAVLADVTAQTIAQTGTTMFRPPFAPVTIAAMGAGAQGDGFAPKRLTAAHDVAVEKGAPMVENGLWMRASYFPESNDTHWRQACDREVSFVRQAVGIADVSTLGKIEVLGKHAGVFLDNCYINSVSTLEVGKIRYAVMLREDGHVLDDGTVTRLGADHFLLSTTTSAADQVLRHLEFVAQARCPELDVRLVPVTEHWAQFAVAGPKARESLAGLCDAPDLGFMSYAQVAIGNVAGRLFRVSFSGELGFELAVPARFAADLFRVLCARAEALGGGAYGLEAMNVLRLEKGFLTHAEMDGRATAFDLGLERMVAKGKDCVGKEAAARPGLRGTTRMQLVGLKPSGAVKWLNAGAIALDGQGAVEGHVTSAGISPQIGVMALAVLRNGRARHGEVIRLRDAMRDVETLCEVCAPVFYDPEGGRARG